MNIQVSVDKMKSDKGHILFILFSGEDGFPDSPDRSVRQGKIPASVAKNGFEISELDSGKYALSIIHDENDNDKLDTNFLGIPTEGVGFSNNPRLMFGAPSYDKCEFELVETQNVKVELKHFL